MKKTWYDLCLKLSLWDSSKSYVKWFRVMILDNIVTYNLISNIQNITAESNYRNFVLISWNNEVFKWTKMMSQIRETLFIMKMW